MSDRLYTILYVGCLLVLLAAISLTYELLPGELDNFSNQVTHFSDHVSEPEVLFLGDSHVAMSVRHEVFGPHVYNYAYPSENLRETYLKLIDAIKKKPSVRVIVLPLDVHIFSSYLANDADVSDYILFGSFRDKLSVYPMNIAFWVKNISYYALPISHPLHRQELVFALKSSVASMLSGDGWTVVKRSFFDENYQLISADQSSWTDRSPEVRSRAAEALVASWFNGGVVDASLLHAMNKILELAHKNNILVVGVRYPLSAELNTALRQWDTSDFDGVVSELPISPILDYRTEFSDRQELFQDSDHLTVSGAYLFSQRLASDLAPYIEEYNSKCF